MALARTNRTSVNTFDSPAANSDKTTSAFTPSNSSLLVCIACIQTADVDYTYTAMTITDSAGLTWTSRIGYSPASPFYGEFYPNLRIWTAPVTTGVSMTVTCGTGGGTNWHSGFWIAVVDYTGYNTGSPTGVTGGEDMATNGADTVTLSGAPASTSEIFGGRGAGVDGAGTMLATPDTGHTELYDLSETDLGGLQVQVRDPGSTSTSFAWADVAAGTGVCYDDIGVALEIKVAAGSGTNVTPTVVAATFVIPTPTFIRTTTPTPTVVAATFVIPTPTFTRTTTPTPTAVAATFVIPTPTFNRTTTPTPTVVAQSWTIPTPVISTAVSATLTKVTGVFTIPTPVVSTGVIVSPTVVAATFVIPTPTLTMSASPVVTVVASTWTIPTPSVTTGSNTAVGATAAAAVFVIPTPAVSGTQIAAVAVAQTWVIPTPAIAGTQVAAVAVAQSWTIPTPAVTTGSTTTVTATAVAMVATIPTPTFIRTTTPTPTAVAMICAAPTPTFTMTANILATVVAAVFVIRGGTPTGQLIGGDASQAFTQAQDASQTLRKVGSSTIISQGATQEFNP